MAKVDVNMSAAGARAILKSGEVLAFLKAKADRIAAAAGAGFESSSMIGPNRARASVITATAKARRAEATNRSLTRAIDAGRG
jgi:hypothetical protein